MDDTSNLFSDVKFVIAECQDADATKNLLIDNGAKHINYLSEHVTLVISDVTCLESDEAMTIFEKPIVSSLWVHLSLKAKRLLPPEAFCPYKNIFHDVVASFSSELTPKDRNILACTLTYHGARVSKDVATCTHLIASKTDADSLPSGNPGLKTVAPDWVLESVRLNSRCNEELFEPSLLLPQPPPPRPPTPPPALPQETEPPKRDPPSNLIAEDNSGQNSQPRTEHVDNPQQNQPQVRVQQSYTSGPQQAQMHHIQSPVQHPPPHVGQHQHVSQYIIRSEAQTHPNPQRLPLMPPQTRPLSNPQRPSHPQMQPQLQVSTRLPTHPQVRMLSPHTQQQQQQQQHHLHHQHSQLQQHQHQQHPHQQQHYQQHPLGHPNQAVGQVRPQSQLSNSNRMVRPQQIISNHLIDPKQNNIRPIHPQQMTSMRHQQPDHTPFENFDQSNHRRPEYANTPQQYQPQSHPRVRQPYSTMPQQTQVHQIQAPIHHTLVAQQPQHVSPDRVPPEIQSQTNPRQPGQMLPQARALTSMQHHPHPQMQSRPQMQPIAQHQHNLQNQHHQQHQHQHQHGHPAQAVMQLRPQSQPAVPQQLNRPQAQVPSHQIDQEQNNMPSMHSPHMTVRLPQSDQVSYDNFNRPRFAGDSPQYQQHPRHPQPYQQASQQSQTHRIQSPMHHLPPPQQQQHVSPDRMQSDMAPSHGLPHQSHPSQGNPHQLQHGQQPQAPVQLRPQLQSGTNLHISRPQSHSLSDQKPINVRPLHTAKVSNIQMNSPRLNTSEECLQPQPHPSIFDHSHESNLAQIKSKVPKLDESVQYFGHDPRQNVPPKRPLFGCKLKLVEYNDIEPGLKESWSRAITDAGASYCNDLAEATILVCETRKSVDYAQAVKLGVRCVTIYWINDIITLNRLTHPWKALHFPLAYSIDERPLTDQIITVTNFRGKDRREVKEMILKTGAKYTDYFSSKNTLIICGAVGGDKYDRAIEWRIPLANCQLLSDILLFGVEDIGQLLAQSKYQNLTRKGPFMLAFHPKISEFLQSWTKPIPLLEPGTPLEPPIFNGNSEDHNPTDSDAQVKTDSNTVNAKIEIKINGIGPDLTIKSENNQPIDHDYLTSTHRNENDVVANEPTPILHPDGVNESKLHSDIQDPTNQKSNDLENVESPPKQSRKSQKPIRLLYTNVGSNLVDSLKEAATKLGLCLASNPKDCTHLLVGQLCRTSKFICAFSHASYILTPAWLLESCAAGEILDEKPFMVKDKEGEEKYSFNLVHSLVKRKRRSDLLFSNWVFFITPSIKKNVPDIEGIIESAGGCVCSKKPPTKKQLEQLKSDGKRMIVVTCDEDYYLCSSLESTGTELVGPEFVISGILRQDIDLDVHRVRKKLRTDYN